MVSATTQLKLIAADGKKYKTDVMDYNQVIELAKNFPNNKFHKNDMRVFDRKLGKQPQVAAFTYMPESTFEQVAEKYVEMNIAHPFRKGNSRTTRIWLDLILKHSLKKCVDWSRINQKEYLEAMEQSVYDSSKIKFLLKNALTDKINDHEMFMKGIDYLYYYEEAE